MAKHAIEVVTWKPCERNTLRGFADIRVRELHLVIYGVAMHERDGSRWTQLPAKSLVIKLVRDDNGRP